MDCLTYVRGFGFLFALLGNTVNGCSTVYGGIGWSGNSTFYVVSQNVTWYSAVHLCKTLFNGKFRHGGATATINVFNYLANNSQFTDNFVWIGYIKSGQDNDIYAAHSCPGDPGYIGHFKNAQKGDGKTECLMMNVSNPDSPYTYDDCLEQHPYVCLETDWSTVNSVIYHNKSVNFTSLGLTVDVNTYSTDKECFEKCKSFFSCVAATYIENSCSRYQAEMDGIFNVNYTFSLDNSNNSAFYLKSLRIAHIQIISNVSNEVTNESVFDCFEDMITQSPTITTSSTCECALKQCHINDTTSANIEDKIREIKQSLYVDKTQLSSTKRKKTCAEDIRPSSKAIGSLGIIILVFVICVLVVADLPYLITFLSNMSKKVKR